MITNVVGWRNDEQPGLLRMDRALYVDQVTNYRSTTLIQTPNWYTYLSYGLGRNCVAKPNWLSVKCSVTTVIGTRREPGVYATSITAPTLFTRNMGVGARRVERHPLSVARNFGTVRRLKQSGWKDSDLRPRRPKRRALTKLRYSPSVTGRGVSAPFPREPRLTPVPTETRRYLPLSTLSLIS